MRLSPWRGPGKWVVFLAVAALGTTGCGQKLGTVTGKVTVKNAGQVTLVKGGMVTFVSTAGKASKATEIKEDGTYTIDKIPVGEVKICVDTKGLKPPAGYTTGTPKYAPPKDASTTGYTPPDPTAKYKLYVPIPPRYAETETTPLTYTVVPGNQPHDITLE